MDQIRKSSELTIRGTLYLYDLQSNPEKLSLSFEEKVSSKRWKAEFASSYIETLTQKSKSFKKFPVFIKMLISGLEGTSDSVIVDLLTYQELEMFRSSRNPGTVSTQQTNAKLLTKRYLILTYSGEFERVHYPLPLSFEEAPDVESLQKTVIRLKAELDQVKKLGQTEYDPVKIIKENEDLKQQIKKIEHNQILAAVPRKGAVEIDTLIRESKLLEQENEKLRLEGTKEAKKMRKENEELQQELDRVKKEMDLIIKQLEKEAGGKAEMDEINSRVLLLTQQCEKAQRLEARYKRELTQLEEEAETLRQNDKKQKQRIKELEEELKLALKSRGNIRASSPGSRSNPRVTNQASIKSPATRSPRISTRLGTPPGSREGSRGSARSGSDRIGVRYSPNQRGRASPNRNFSPSNSYGRKNGSPIGRLRTPPNKASPLKKPSPQQSPFNRKKENEVKKVNKSDDVDSRLKKLTDLLKNARS